MRKGGYYKFISHCVKGIHPIVSNNEVERLVERERKGSRGRI